MDENDPGPPLPKKRVLTAMLAELDDHPEAESAQVDADLLRALLEYALYDPTAMPGAVIHDHYRDTTYRATIDHRGRLDHLETVTRGVGIDENALRRVPVDRIRSAVFEQVQKQQDTGEDSLVFTLPGGVRFDGDGPPDPEELAKLMNEYGMRRQELARHYRTNVKNVDRWVRNGRRTRPDLPWPARKQGRRTDLPKTTGQQAGTTRKEQQ